MPFSILLAPKDEEFCAITKRPDALRNPARPTRGISMAGTYGKTLDFAMSKLVHPKGLRVPDAILNAVSYLIVSDRLKEVLARHAGKNAEFMPFRLLDHNGKPRGTVYVVNVLGTIDCADRSRSEGRISPFEQDQGAFIECARLAIDARRIPPDVAVFRASLFPPLVFVRDDVRAEIEALGMTVRFVAPGEPV